MSVPKKKKTIEHIAPNCKARIIIDSNGKCSKNKIAHTHHEHHEEIYKDLAILNSIKEKCRFLGENFPTSSHKITEKEVFLAEIAKLVTFLCFQCNKYIIRVVLKGDINTIIGVVVMEQI